MKPKSSFLGFGSALVLATLGVASACGSSDRSSGFDLDSGTSGGPTFGSDSSFGDGGTPTACTGLQCAVAQCSGGSPTTLTGKVVAPTPSQYGAPDPIYNAIVYVPNAAVEPFPEGATCDKCGAVTSGDPIATALTGADGTFSLQGVPTGTNIPLVIQVGRWRRQVTIDNVESCKETPLDTELTRLPRNKSEGDIPLMAIATSPYDPTECIMRKIGIDDAEITSPTGGGRVHLYIGAGATIAGAPASSTLWATPASLQKYDLVAFPCQTEGKPDVPGRANIKTYADGGGRVYVTDLSEDIIMSGPTGWPTTANWGGSGFYSNPASIDTTFPKGDALADWLQGIGATTTKGQMDLDDTYARFTSVNAPSQRWLYSSTTTQTYSFNTPVEAQAADQCGRVVYSSFHIANGSAFDSAFPTECTSGPLTAQEKVLEFLLFDLASCIQTDTTAPTPPPVVK